MASESIAEHVLYHPEHQSLICLECKYGLLSKIESISR